jgi:hypothetical protein
MCCKYGMCSANPQVSDVPVGPGKQDFAHTIAAGVGAALSVSFMFSVTCMCGMCSANLQVSDVPGGPGKHDYLHPL